MILVPTLIWIFLGIYLLNLIVASSSRTYAMIRVWIATYQFRKETQGYIDGMKKTSDKAKDILK
jgi:hypothetical protein